MVIGKDFVWAHLELRIDVWPRTEHIDPPKRGAKAAEAPEPAANPK